MGSNVQEKKKTLLQELIELHELAFVTIMRGYLQLNFDGPYLNVYTMPEIGEDGASIKLTDMGYYDRLCRLVGKKVISAKEFPGICLILAFEGDVFLRISLKPEDRQCAEAVMLQGENGKQWMVW
ncbi:hypothetical protein ISP15_04930 [Dyella jejuensis]|uniref:Uncharacterized protein n=1 Tax=Dyella jejuensis TaxID=1432009 RepID=A0ABW8JF09_9GAMM